MRVISGRRYQFNDPGAIAVDGGNGWVANADQVSLGGSVTEIDVSTGRLVRTVMGHTYKFANPMAIAISGGRVWLANSGDPNSVTELSAGSGALVRVIAGDSYGFDQPRAMVADHLSCGSSTRTATR